MRRASPDEAGGVGAARQRRDDAQSPLLREQARLRADLARVGCRVKWVWDFLEMPEAYTEAIPVLIRHLSLPYGDATHEGIVRALAVREARGLAGSTIVALLGRAGVAPGLRRTLARTLAVVADRTNRAAISTLLNAEKDPDVSADLARSLVTAARPCHNHRGMPV